MKKIDVILTYVKLLFQRTYSQRFYLIKAAFDNKMHIGIWNFTAQSFKIIVSLTTFIM